MISVRGGPSNLPASRSISISVARRASAVGLLPTRVSFGLHIFELRQLVEHGERNILRHADAVIVEFGQRARRHQIIGEEDRRRQILAVLVEQPGDRFTARRREVAALEAQGRIGLRAVRGKPLLETVGARHGFAEEGRAGDMGDAPVALPGEIFAHQIAAAEIVELDAVDRLVGQMADEHGWHVNAEQRVMHAVQGKVADDHTVDALAPDLAQIFAAMFLRMAAGHVGVEDQRIESDRLELRLRGLHQLRVERVADIGDEHGDDVGAPGAQALRLRVGRIAELVDRRLHALAQRAGDTVGMIDHVRDRRARHAGSFRNP